MDPRTRRSEPPPPEGGLGEARAVAERATAVAARATVSAERTIPDLFLKGFTAFTQCLQLHTVHTTTTQHLHTRNFKIHTTQSDTPWRPLQPTHR